MNILTSRLPESVLIDGEEYAINTDYRVGLKIMMLFEDPDFSPREKAALMLRLLYPVIPTNIGKAQELAIRFLDCGETREPVPTDAPRRYSFHKDAKYIYTGIQQTHGIDLESVGYLHWWKFVYLFMDLSGECMFSRILDLRKRRAEGKLMPEEKRFCSEIKDVLDLPAFQTSEEKAVADEFMRRLKG